MEIYKIEIQAEPFKPDYINNIKQKAVKQLGIAENEVDYLVFNDKVSNNTYSVKDGRITILYNNGETTDLSEASELLGADVVSRTIIKYFLCYPKELVRK